MPNWTAILFEILFLFSVLFLYFQLFQPWIEEALGNPTPGSL